MSLTTPAKTTSHTEKDESKAIYAAGTRDRDAPIVLVVPRIRLVASGDGTHSPAGAAPA